MEKEEAFDLSGVPKEQKSVLRKSLDEKKKQLKEVIKHEIDFSWEDAAEIAKPFYKGILWKFDYMDCSLQDCMERYMRNKKADDLTMYTLLSGYLDKMYLEKCLVNKKAIAFYSGWEKGKKKEWKKQIEDASTDVVLYLWKERDKTIKKCIV